jgi:hypothetical protein
MNAYLGWSGSSVEITSGYRVFQKASDLDPLGHDKVFVFAEVHPDNICLPAFMVYMPGEGLDGFYHYPAGHHSRGSALSFADGHIESRRWLDPRTTPPVAGQILGHWDSSPGNQDLEWLRERTTARLEPQ